MGWTSEVAADFLVGEAKLTPYLIPYGFLSGDGQRQVDAVQSHPVDEMLPLFPIPPGHGVAKSAVVQEETLWNPGSFTYFCWDFGQCRRHLQSLLHEPWELGVTIIFEVSVQPNGHAVGVVSSDNDYITLTFKFIAVDSVSESFQLDMVGEFGNYTIDQLAHGNDFRVGFFFVAGNDKQ